MLSDSPPNPADSATVVLLREAAPNRVEVLLVARHAQSRAFAGAHVFPGGLLDDADRSDELVQAVAPRMSPDMAHALLGEDVEPTAALAFWIGTIRELFEEAGILLADADGAPVRFTDPATRDRFASHRRALLDGTLSFGALVTAEKLVLRADVLRYYSRWITPVQAPRRYDARFFFAPVPADQTPLHDDRETTSAEWMTPAEALARAAAGSLILTPPTARTLEDLIDLGGLTAILASTQGRRVTPILPKVVQIGDRMGVLYPGDVDYAATDSGATLPAETVGPLNRAIMDDAGWRRFRGERVA